MSKTAQTVLSAATVRKEAEEIAARVEAAEPDKKSRTFYDGVRASRIPYLPCSLEKQAGELYARSYEACFIFGRTSLPLTVGLCMHVYNLASLATLPVPQVPEFERRRKILVDTIRKYRSLLAISSFGENIKNKDAPFRNLVLTLQPDGNYLCKGRKGFQSMASEADLLLFSGYVGDEMGMFWTNLKNQPTITKGPSLFPGAMALTDTRPLEFNDLVIKPRNVLSLTNQLTDHLSYYATAWFEALVSAAYLGAASRALEEVRKFARSVHTSDGTMLAELDGFVVDSGRLSIKLRSALALARSFGICADRYCTLMREHKAPREVLDGVADDLCDVASAIKYTGTQTAVEVVHGARVLIGTRSMHPSHPVHALTEQILFGPMHPALPAHFERGAGESMLGEDPYLGLFEWALD